MRTAEFRNAGSYSERSSIWSEIKPVYMDIQNYKCAFCEKRLSGEEIGTIEHDIEHFRPKKKITNWKIPKSLNGVPITKAIRNQPGHHLLAYNPFNYTTSCKPCNSILKKNNFPIEGQYDVTQASVISLIRYELPYLLYPLGNFDKNPEDLFFFVGIHPVSKGNSLREENRARVTIEFFKLNDHVQRKHLFIQRAETILALYRIMETIVVNGIVDEEDAKEFANRTSLHAPHANCARSFMILYKNDRDEAYRVFKDAQKYYNSVSK
ncbi:hypothetical protein V1387_10415 [Allomuricauda taeanensis]|nr:hypothetical protein [Allomuricauda taeanensis]